MSIHQTIFINHKGGVGKTATVLGIAGALIERGERVLLVDLDPQASLSLAVGAPAPSISLLEALESDIAGSAGDAVTTSTWGDSVCVIPSNLQLGLWENRVELGSQYRLRTALEGVAERLGVHHVLIDAPPMAGHLVACGLTTATHVAVITTPTAAAIAGVESVNSTVQTIRRYFNESLAVLGVVVNNVLPRQREAQTQLLVLDEMLGQQLIQPFIPARACINEAAGRGIPLREMFGAEVRTVRDIYTQLADVLLPTTPKES